MGYSNGINLTDYIGFRGIMFMQLHTLSVLFIRE